jgi:hypothetical protein
MVTEVINLEAPLWMKCAHPSRTFSFDNIVTHMTIAGQRLGTRIPEVTLSTIEGYPVLGNGAINTNS